MTVGRTSSNGDGGSTDATDFELSAFPPCNRNEEQRQLFELPHPRPLRGVTAALTGANLSGAKMFLLGAIAEDEEQHDTTVGAVQGTSRFFCPRPNTR
jgi:hypothetical protein